MLNLKSFTEQERRQEATLFSQIDELWQIQQNNLLRQISDEKLRSEALNEKINILTSNNSKFKAKLSKEIEERKVEKEGNQNNSIDSKRIN